MIRTGCAFFRAELAWLVLTAGFALNSTAYAQLGMATLSGTAQDPSGGSVPMAEITLESTVQKFSRHTVTDAEGAYVIPAIPPGSYRLVVRAAGFKPETISAFSLDSGQASTLNVALALLSATEQMTVTEAPPLLQTTNATIGSVVQSKQVTELPVLGRNFSRVLLTIPGVSPTDAPDTSNLSVGGLAVFPSFYGQRQRDNDFTLDGVGNVDPLFQHVVLTPPPEAIAEMKIESGMSSGVYGHASGATINVVTKAGSNGFHGDLWEALRNNKMNARSFFTPTLGPNKWNQFGGAAGGPVVIPHVISKERAWYFFGYYEGIRIRSTTSFSALVPTANELSGNFGGDPIIYNPYTTRPVNGAQVRDPFPNNVIPSNLLNASALTIAKALYPLPNIPIGLIPGAPKNYLNGGAGGLTNSDQWSGRTDHQFGKRDAFYARYSDRRDFTQSVSLPALPSQKNNRLTNLVVSDTHIFGPSLVLTGRFGLTRVNSTSITPPIAGLAQQAGTLTSYAPFAGQEVIPPLTIPGYPSLSQGVGYNGPEYEAHWTGDGQKIKGRHTIDFGGAIIRTQFITDNATGIDAIFSTAQTSNFLGNTGSALGSYVLGLPQSADRVAGTTAGDMYGNAYSLYVQDTFRVSQRLTLNFGVRYEYASPMINRRGSGTFIWETGQYYWSRTNPITNQPANIPLGAIPPDRNNFAPRTGVAYQINSRTVVRTSYGIFYDTFGVNYAQQQQGNRGNWPFSFPQTVSGLNATVPDAFFPNPFPGPAAGATSPQGCIRCLNIYGPSTRTPYVQEWSGSVQRQITPSLMAEGVYFGSHGIDLTGHLIDNTAETPGPGPIPQRRRWPQFPSFVMNEYNQYPSFYDGMSVKLDKRFSKGLSFQANYTWSKTIDELDSIVSTQSSTPTRFNIPQFRGVSGYDVTHRVVLSGIFDIPGKTGNRFADAALANWSVSTIATFDCGLPYSVFLNSDNENIGTVAGNLSEFPNLVGNPSASGQRTLTKWFNTSAFALPAAYTRGNAGRNILRGDGLSNFDFSAFKRWPFQENRSLEFRAEFFDLTNHTTFDIPGYLLGTPQFGRFPAPGTPAARSSWHCDSTFKMQNRLTSRRSFLRGIPGLVAPLASPLFSDTRRPNIVMILCDDLGYGDLGCYGNRIILTPNVDRLAANGTRFTQFYMTPSCSPSRSSFMTGQYPQRYNVQASDLPESRPRYGLPPSAFTIGKALQAVGYYTAHVGKWHVGEPPQTVAPRKQGFDYFFGGFGGRPSSPWSKYARSMDPEMIENEDRPVVFKGHVTAVETDAAVRVLSRMTKDRPFFLNLCYNSPHEPLAPLSYQKELYESWSAPEQTYFQTVTDLDRGIGRVLKTLEELGFADNTLIVLSSDNGPEKHSYPYSRGSAGPLRGMKATLWEGGIRVPCILNWPGKAPAGRVSTEVSSVLDLFPTFCTAANAPVPKNLDGGIDLMPVANGHKPAAERDIFVEYHMPQRVVPPSLPMMMRTGKWKLFSNHKFEAFELYDLDADVGEQHSVAAAHPEVVRNMRHRLEAWWSQFAKMDVSGVRTTVSTPTPDELDKIYYKN